MKDPSEVHPILVTSIKRMLDIHKRQDLEIADDNALGVVVMAVIDPDHLNARLIDLARKYATDDDIAHVAGGSEDNYGPPPEPEPQRSDGEQEIIDQLEASLTGVGAVEYTSDEPPEIEE